MKTALTIAGSDSSGGAGIQADIKTFACNGVYGMSAITALTAQNTERVSAVSEVSADFLEKQIEATVSDIFPDAVKVGMVSSAQLIDVIEKSIRRFGLKHLVVDPVMVSTSGSKLITDGGICALEKLFPLASLVTPNIPEAEILCGKKIDSAQDMEEAGKFLSEKFGTNFLIKGGHAVNDANDFLSFAESAQFGENAGGLWFSSKKIKNPNTHGTGCTLSSTIAANLAKGFALAESVKNAKRYLTDCLNAMLDLGKGSGPLMHNFKFFENI